MLAGESGADYVMFGEPDADGRRPSFDAMLERVAWWAEMLEIPCVAYAASLDEVEPLAAAGADFIAVGDFVWRDARAVAEAANLGMAEPRAMRWRAVLARCGARRFCRRRAHAQPMQISPPSRGRRASIPAKPAQKPTPQPKPHQRPRPSGARRPEKRSSPKARPPRAAAPSAFAPDNARSRRSPRREPSRRPSIPGPPRWRRSRRSPSTRFAYRRLPARLLSGGLQGSDAPRRAKATRSR